MNINLAHIVRIEIHPEKERCFAANYHAHYFCSFPCIVNIFNQKMQKMILKIEFDGLELGALIFSLRRKVSNMSRIPTSSFLSYLEEPASDSEDIFEFEEDFFTKKSANKKILEIERIQEIQAAALEKISQSLPRQV